MTFLKIEEIWFKSSTLEIVKRSDTVKGFEVLPRRWGVNAFLHGWGDAEDWPKTSREPSLLLKRGFISQISACSQSASQDADKNEFFMIQPLSLGTLNLRWECSSAL